MPGFLTEYSCIVDATGTPTAATPIGSTDSGALITHTAAAVGTSGADQTNSGTQRGVKVVVDITAITGTTPTLTVTIQGKDAASGKYYTILASAALSTVSTTVLTVYPAMVAVANLTANDVIPKTYRVISSIGGTTPAVTATIGVCPIY